RCLHALVARQLARACPVCFASYRPAYPRQAGLARRRALDAAVAGPQGERTSDDRRSKLDAMTANLDLVRSIYTLWESADHRYWAASEIQYATVGIPEPAGPDSTVGSSAPPKESFREWLSAWSDWKAAAENYIELDREHVLVPYQSATPGKARRAGSAPR